MVLAVNNLIGFGGGGGGNIPSFIGASTGTTNTASNTLAINYPSGIQANDIIICAVEGEDSAGTSAGDTTITDVTNFTMQAQIDGGGGKSGGAVFYKRATGSESGTETATMNSLLGTRAMTGTMWLFRGCITTGDPTNGGSAQDNAASSTWSQKTLTTTVDNCLAVHIITAVADSATAGSFTGATGGNWIEASIYSAANGTLQLQTAAMYSAGTISGGSVTASVSGKYGATVFGLKPAT